jgi:hypothetical protein
MKRNVWEYIRDGLMITGGLYLATIPSSLNRTQSIPINTHSSNKQAIEQRLFSQKLASRWIDRGTKDENLLFYTQ